MFTLRQAVSLGVPGADVQFVRTVWLYGRDEATEAEKRQADELATGAVIRNHARGDGVTRDLEQGGQLFDLAEYMGADVAPLREAVGLPREPEEERS